MPVQVSYPGIYIEEIASTPTTVTSATTSATAFADFFVRGPIGQAVMVTNFSDFQRIFGGLNPRSEASYGILQYFNNGGQTAWVIRLGDGSARSASLSVPVNLPQASSLANQASQAAASALQAAQRAQQAVGQAVPYQAAQQAGEATSQAADYTLQAASATNALAQELELDIEEFNAQYGTEAGATYDAAQAAADAAAEAAAAAQVASAAAADAATAAGNLSAPTNQATPAAATDTAAGATLAQTAAKLALTAPLTKAETTAIKQGQTKGDFTGVTIAETGTAATAWTNAIKVLTDLNTAIASATDATQKAQLQALVQPVLLLTSAATAQLTAASDTTAAANQAATDAPNAAGTSPTVSVQMVLNELTAAASSAQNLGSKASDLASVTANTISTLANSGLVLSAAPGQTLQSDLTALQTAIPAVQQGAATTLGWANWAQAAATNWHAATQEADNLSDAGAASAAATAEQNASGASTTAQQLQSTATATQVSSLFASTPNLATLITNLNDAAKGFTNATSTQIATNVANLKAGAAAAKTAWTTAAADTGYATYAANIQQLTAQLAAETEAAYLSGLIAQDLATGVTPLDVAQAAAVAAAAAAQDAALKAAVAVAKARQAELAAQQDAAAASNDLTITAANPGTWGNNLQVQLTSRPGFQFDLTVQEMAVRNGSLKAINTETYRGLTLGNANATNYAPALVNDQSQMIQLTYAGPNIQGTYPNAILNFQRLAGGANGNPPRANNLFPVTDSDGPGLVNALNNIAPNTFNILCLPIVATYSPNEASTAITNAMNYAASQHAFYIVDIPANIDSTSRMQTWMSSYGNAGAYNAAVYYPRLLMPDPLVGYRLRNVGASGTLAGVYARNDLAYGVWETPAGINAVMEGVQLATTLTDTDNGTLNELGVNCLRTFPVYGNVVWGGRTMAGADGIGSQWKYLSVRRLADFIEQSLLASLRWVVFQNNDPRLWQQIRLQVGSFMSGLFAAGAFAGATATAAYLVKCDSTTTTQTDIDNGIVNILVGFAPEKPAEFVILQLEQLTATSAS